MLLEILSSSSSSCNSQTKYVAVTNEIIIELHNFKEKNWHSWNDFKTWDRGRIDVKYGVKRVTYQKLGNFT